MTKLITRCFQRGGALSNAYRRLAKSALTAFALIDATFTANADVPATTLALGPQGVDVPVVYNGTYPKHKVDNIKNIEAYTVAAVVNTDNVTVDSGKYAVVWSLGSFADNTLGLMLTKNDQGAISLHHVYKRASGAKNYRFRPYTPSTNPNDDQGKPYCTAGTMSSGYHLVVATFDTVKQEMSIKVDDGNVFYAEVSSDNTNKAYGNLEKLNKTDDAGFQIGSPYGAGNSPNPLTSAANVAVGKIMAWDSALTEDQLDELWNENKAFVNALNIDENDAIPGANFSFGPDPANAPVGWFTAWNAGFSNNRMIGPSANAFVVTAGNWNNTGINTQDKTAVTIAAIVNTDLVDASSQEAMLWSFGRTNDGASGLLLTKSGGKDDYTLNLRHTGSSTNVASVSGCSSGFHLVSVTFEKTGDTASKIQLWVDGVASGTEGAATEVSAGALSGNGNGGIQLIGSFGGNPAGSYAVGTNTAFERLMGWDSVLTPKQQTALWNLYKDSLGEGGVISLAYDADFSTDNATIYVPNVDADEHSVKVGSGNLGGVVTTAKVPAGAEAKFAAVEISGKGTVDVDGGSLEADVFKYSFRNGKWAANVNVSNGGTLAIGGFEGGSNLVPAFNLGNGTLTAASVKGEDDGFDILAEVAFNDADNGTTIDLNGRNVSFIGNVFGSGKAIVKDDSETPGTVKFGSLGRFTGTIEVQNGTIDIGAARPASNAKIEFASGTGLVLKESLADEDGVVPLNFTGITENDITIYSADGKTPLAATITEDGKIKYTPSDNHIVSGEACWYDFGFNDSSYASEGRNKTAMMTDANNSISRYVNTDFKNDAELYVAASTWMNITYPKSWSAAIYGTVPAQNNAVLAAFGTKDGGLIGLVAGDASKGEVKLVRTTGNSAAQELTTFVATDPYKSKHLYVFSKTPRQIDIYLDGIRCATKKLNEDEADITFGAGFQIGSVNGGTGATGLYQFKANDAAAAAQDLYQNAVIDALRIYDSPLTYDAMLELKEEFKYISENGLYTRTIDGDATWATNNGGWASKAADGTTGTANAPADNGEVELVASGANATTVTIGAAGDPATVSVSSLTIDGSAAVTLAAAEGSTLNNSGNTIIKTDVTVSQGVNLSGGALVIESGKSLTFDYSGYRIPHETADQTIILTGLSSSDDRVIFIAPTETRGRTWTFAFDESTEKWVLTITREKQTLVWTAGDADWTTTTPWNVYGSDEVATFFAGDDVIFGDIGTDGSFAQSATVTVPAAVAFGNGSITVNATTTQYAIGGTINVDGAELKVSGAEAAITDLRGTLGAVSLTASAVTLGSGGELTLPAGTTVTVGTETALKIAGTGTVKYRAGSDAFQGTLEVASGTFDVDCAFANVTATRENPIKVTGGRLYAHGGMHAHDRLPKGAFVEVSGSGVLEAAGNNIFPAVEDNAHDGMTFVDEDAPTIICKNGGTFQVDGTGDSDHIRVGAVELDSGNIYFNGTIANWNNEGLRIDSGVLKSRGTSTVTRQVGSPNIFVIGDKESEVNVVDGTLTLEITVSGDLVKTGDGALSLGADDGHNNAGGRTGVVRVESGTLVATTQLVNHKVNTDLVFAGGTTLDISGVDGAYDLSDFTSVTLNGKVTLDLGERTVEIGDEVLAVDTALAGRGRFNAKTESGKTYTVEIRDGGAYLTSGAFVFILR